MDQFLLIIDATTRSNQFKELNAHRPIASIPFFGKYKLVDFPLTSAYHAECFSVGVFTKDSARSLRDHLGGGKFWNLDRNRSGLFILPSSNLDIAHEPMISYLRLRDHIDLLNKCRKKYVIITHAYGVYNLSYDKLIENHIASGADISCAYQDDDNLGIFIIDTRALIALTLSSGDRGNMNLGETFINPGAYVTNRIQIDEPVYLIKSIVDYYRVSMDLLNDRELQNKIFSREHYIVSKVHQAFPAHIHVDAKVKHSIVENGCHIYGDVSHSILFNKVTIGAGSQIKHSIIFVNTVIGKNVKLKHVIIDKDVTIEDGVVLEGTKQNPIYIQKRTVVRK